MVNNEIKLADTEIKPQAIKLQYQYYPVCMRKFHENPYENPYEKKYETVNTDIPEKRGYITNSKESEKNGGISFSGPGFSTQRHHCLVIRR